MRDRKSILVLDGNSSQCLPLIGSFYKLGYKVVLVCPGIFSAGYFSRYVHKRVIWPRITGNEEEFYELLIGHIASNKYDLVLGLGDVSAGVLSRNKDHIEQHTKTMVPDYHIFSVAADKYQTMKFCMKHDIPCPVTLDSESDLTNPSRFEINFPVVVKPKKGVGAVGFSIYHDIETLEHDLPGLRKQFGPVLIQEYISNEIQYTAEVFCDHLSEMKACVVAEKTRFFPTKGGTSSCNVTMHSSEIEYTLEKMLKQLNWTGSANIDLILDPRDNTAKVIEINPRAGAIIKIAFLAGVDIGQMIICSLKGEDVEGKRVYTDGIIMRNMMLDMLWFIFTSFRTIKGSNPSFFKFAGKGVHYQVFRLDDPFPVIGFIGGNIRKYCNIEKLKRKLNLD